MYKRQLYNHVLPIAAMAYWVLFVAVLLFSTPGRVDRLSICRGLGLGLLVGAAASYTNYFTGSTSTAEGYAGRLTGFIWTDPNQYGYYLTVLGALALIGARPGWPRSIGIVVIGIAVVLTLSRTSMAAMTVAAVWFALRRYQRLWVAVLATGTLGYIAVNLFERLQNLSLIHI